METNTFKGSKRLNGLKCRIFFGELKSEKRREKKRKEEKRREKSNLSQV